MSEQGSRTIQTGKGGGSKRLRRRSCTDQAHRCMPLVWSFSFVSWNFPRPGQLKRNPVSSCSIAKSLLRVGSGISGTKHRTIQVKPFCARDQWQWDPFNASWKRRHGQLPGRCSSPTDNRTCWPSPPSCMIATYSEIVLRYHLTFFQSHVFLTKMT